MATDNDTVIVDVPCVFSQDLFTATSNVTKMRHKTHSTNEDRKMSPEGQNGQQPGKKATRLYLTMMNYSSCCNKDFKCRRGTMLDNKCWIKFNFKFGMHMIWFLFIVIPFNINQEGAIQTLCAKQRRYERRKV